MRSLFKFFLFLISLAGILVTLFVVYTNKYSQEKPKWLVHFSKNAENELAKVNLKRKSYIQKVHTCMDEGGKCEPSVGVECDKNVYHLFFRCIGLKKDERKVIPVNSNYQ